MLLPLVTGLVISRAAAGFSTTWAGNIGVAGALVLVLTALAQLPSMLSALGALVGNGALLVMASYATATLLIGHLIGGPDPERRTVLALATTARHPAIAMSLAYANFADERLAAPAVLLLAIVTAAATAAYVMMTRRRYPAAAPTTQATRH
jgi:BASS family bile acid:Na+ symporter